MPQIIPCPECANRIRITDELIGKRIRCPRCNNTFDAMRPSESSPVTTVADPIPEPPSPRPLPRDLPRPPKQEPTLESGAAETGTWEIVLTGVNFQVAGHLLAMGGGLLIFVSFFLIIVGMDDRTGPAPSFFDRLMGVGVQLGALLLAGSLIASLAANGFGLAAPMSRGSRPLATTGLVLSALVLVAIASHYQLLGVLLQPGVSVVVPDTMFIRDMDPRYSGFRGSADIERNRIATALVAILSVTSLPMLLDLARLTAVPMFVRSIGHNLRDRGTASNGKTAVGLIALAFFATLGLELLLRLRNRTGPSHTRDDETVVAFLLAFALAAARLLILLIGLFSLLRARAALIRHLRAAVRAEVP